MNLRLMSSNTASSPLSRVSVWSPLKSDLSLQGGFFFFFRGVVVVCGVVVGVFFARFFGAGASPRDLFDLSISYQPSSPRDRCFRKRSLSLLYLSPHALHNCAEPSGPGLHVGVLFRFSVVQFQTAHTTPACGSESSPSSLSIVCCCAPCCSVAGGSPASGVRQSGWFCCPVVHEFC